MNFIKENYIIFLSILVVLIILLIVLKVLKSKKVVKKPLVDNNVLESIYNALGLENIVSIEKEQDRVKFILKDTKLVDAKVLSELSIPAFLKGNEVKLLYRNYSNELFEYIKERIGN